MHIQIRSMEERDIPVVITIMVKAFQDRALYCYFLEDDKEREHFLQTVFTERIQSAFGTRTADIALFDGMPVGAALWTQPGVVQKENQTIAQITKDYGGALDAKWQHFHQLLFKNLAAACTRPHWSLSPIAVMPVMQGQGVAKALLQTGLARIDASGCPCLLATQDIINTSIYTKYGFTMLQEFVIAKERNLNCWIMLR